MTIQPANSIALDAIIKKFKLSIGAELGVRRGDLCSFLLENNKNLQIVAVDVWDTHQELNEQHDHKSNYDIYKNKVSRFESRIIEYKLLTTEAYQYIADESLDFIYMDATHTYNAFIKDFKVWNSKVKPTGIICGHDYCDYFDNGGLKKAIDECVGIDITIPRTENDYGATEEILKVLELTDKGVADSQTGCWFKWKKNITNN